MTSVLRVTLSRGVTIMAISVDGSIELWSNAEWCARFPGYKVVNRCPEHLDHGPIILTVHGSRRNLRPRAHNMNKLFEATWLLEDDCEGIVVDAWAKAGSTGEDSVAQ
jgi:hypothetical protein